MKGGEGPCGPSPPEIRTAYFGGVRHPDRFGVRVDQDVALVMGYANIATTHSQYAHLDTSDILIDVARIDSLI